MKKLILISVVIATLFSLSCEDDSFTRCIPVENDSTMMKSTVLKSSLPQGFYDFYTATKEGCMKFPKISGNTGMGAYYYSISGDTELYTVHFNFEYKIIDGVQGIRIDWPVWVNYEWYYLVDYKIILLPSGYELRYNWSYTGAEYENIRLTRH